MRVARQSLSFIALFVLAIALILGGFEGSVGRLLACLLVPSLVEENNG